MRNIQPQRHYLPSRDDTASSGCLLTSVNHTDTREGKRKFNRVNLRPYIHITLECMVNRVILHSLRYILKSGSPAAAIHGGPQRSTAAYSDTQAQSRLANSRQRMLTAASCPTRIDVVGRRHRAERDPDV